MWTTLRGALRSRTLILAELLLVALAGVLLTLVPQQDEAPLPPEHWLHAHPALVTALRVLELDRVLRAHWFAALIALATVTLSVVLVDQWRRAARVLVRAPEESQFHDAPLRGGWERDVVPGTAALRFQVSGRAAGLGPPVFHSGLWCVVVAGLLRVLWGADAQVDLVEGETLRAGPGAWSAQWPGPLAAAVSLEAPMRFDRLRVARYASLDLRGLVAEVTHGDEPVEVAVNTPLNVGPERVHLALLHGPAVLLEVAGARGAERAAVLAWPSSTRGVYEGTAVLETGMDVVARARIDEEAHLPAQVELRVKRGSALLFVGAVAAGAVFTVEPGTTFTVHGIRWWARFNGSRDIAWWLAYAGFALCVLGAMLMFLVTRVDTLVRVTPCGAGRERVEVVLRPHRFAPLYRERLDQVARSEGWRGEGPP
ncbi:MAG: cytochrome c biogenesis protein ResB [Deltaproteobacteria bacterium]|nr:cytochrome c biogenesis protein ResB [Deltaproteobacteria bacterium]